MSDYLEIWLDSESAGQNVIAVKTIYIDINDGCLTDGFLFSQIVYWSGNNKEGQYRARVFVNNQRWIVKEADEWFSECRIKDSTARASLDRIMKRGLIIKEVHRFGGLAKTHIRINPEIFEKRIKLALQGLPMPRIDKNQQSEDDDPGLLKSSKAGLPKSSNVYTETTITDTQEDIDTNVSISAAPPTALTADTHLTPQECEIMRQIADGISSARYFEEKVLAHLIELGVVEQCGDLDTIALKDKCPKKPQPLTGCNGLPEHIIRAGEKADTSWSQYVTDGKVATQLEEQIALLVGDPEPTQEELLANLRTSLQEARDDQTHPISELFPSSQSENPPAPNSAPPPSPAPAPLPDVPEEYGSFQSGGIRHYATQQEMRKKHQMALCGMKPDFENPLPAKYQCPDCATRAAAKPRKAKAAKPVKAAIYSSSPLFDAIAAFSFKATDKADVNAVAGRVGKIRAALCDYVIDKLKGEPTPEQTAKVVQRVKDMCSWYDTACKKCDRPQSADTFMTWYVRYIQSTNGTAQGEGNGYFFDNGWFKRESGKLYRQDERNSETWIEVAK
jgi:hypothetical protein